MRYLAKDIFCPRSQGNVVSANSDEQAVNDLMDVHCKFLPMSFVFKLFKVLIMKLHHIQQQINSMHVDLEIFVSATFIENCKQSNKYLLSFSLVNLAEVKLGQASVQINESL